MGELINLADYKAKKEAEVERAEEDKIVECFINHAKTLKWDD